ncbi:uncharacterized protein LOC135123296 isoform X2 [Zophobas morio]|uniref:uncharacterized protein LOC135123296 isoform X2 n=1 Tax=Zophobas morio TaxID=2755281 RepID=UPI003082CFFA
MYVKLCFQIDLKYPTILIGIFHLLFLLFRIYEIALDLYVLEEVIQFNQLTYIVLINMLQLGIIHQHVCLLPWLCFTAPIFCMATAYGTLYVATGDCIQSIINFVFIVFFWSSWYIVFKNYLSLKNTLRYSPFRGYRYSSTLKSINNEIL